MSPIVERDFDDLIAHICHPLLPLGMQSEIGVWEFLAQVKLLSTQLPQGRYALNMCGNRYLFLLAFCAVIIRDQTNLLPPNKNLETQKHLAARYPGSYIIHDSGALPGGPALQLETTLHSVNLADIKLSAAMPDFDCPEVDDDHLCAICFTSGSTGESSPNLKYWRTLRDSSRINVRYMTPELVSSSSLLATVPGQHMWGLETSILNPLFGNLAISDQRPLFPKDIQTTLASLPEPRILVSTPVHLRALLASGLAFPPVERVLCATAPLRKDLATQVEHLFQGELCEIYGCSEVGSMAYRRTRYDGPWNLFEGFQFLNSESAKVIRAAHLPTDVPLQDLVEQIDTNKFLLCGRTADLVEIAGKRGSLQEINQALLNVEAVADGVVFQPENDERRVPRLVAMVVLQNGFDKQQLVGALRSKLDEAFVPRPIYLVDALPREDSGKLAKKRLESLFISLSSRNFSPVS